jgi:hypothetical protein
MLMPFYCRWLLHLYAWMFDPSLISLSLSPYFLIDDTLPPFGFFFGIISPLDLLASKTEF